LFAKATKVAGKPKQDSPVTNVASWAAEEDVSSCSLTACSDHFESSQSLGDDENNDPTKCLDISTQIQPLVLGEAGNRGNGIKAEFSRAEGISIVITTSR